MPLALKVLAGDKVPLIAYTDHVVLTEQNLPEYYPPACELLDHSHLGPSPLQTANKMVSMVNSSSTIE